MRRTNTNDPTQTPMTTGSWIPPVGTRLGDMAGLVVSGGGGSVVVSGWRHTTGSMS